MVSEIYDVLYLNQIEKILRRRLTPTELGEIYVYGEFDLFVGNHHFLVEIPTYVLPYDLIDTNDMDVIYSVSYSEIVRKTIHKDDGTSTSKYAYLDIMNIRHSRPTHGQYKSGKHFIDFLQLLARSLSVPEERR